MLKKVALACSVLIILNAGAIFAQEGDQLERYKVITPSQKTESALTETLNRNELFVLLDKLTINLTSKKSSQTFKDIIPNASFSNIANRLAGLDLILPDQKTGMFKPAKEVTYEDACYLMLGFIGHKTSYETALQDAYEQGLLEGIRIYKKDTAITRKHVYHIIELTLNQKQSNGSVLSDTLKLAASDNVVGPTETKTKEAETLLNIARITPLTDKQVLISFNDAPGKTSLDGLELVTSKQLQLKPITYAQVTPAEIIFTFKESLTQGEVYQVNKSSGYAFKFDKQLDGKLYCNEGYTRTLNNHEIKIAFNNYLNPESALNLVHYKSIDGLNFKGIKFARRSDGTIDMKAVVLTSDDQVPGKYYRIAFQNGLKDINGNEIANLPVYRNISVFGAGYDLEAPSISRVSALSLNEVQIDFNESSGLEAAQAENPLNYKLTDIESGKNYTISNVQLKMNPSTGVFSQVKLTVSPLDRLKRFMVEVNNLKDTQGNDISKTSGFRGSFALTTFEEERPKLINVESVSSNLIKLSFNKNVYLASQFELEDVQLTSDVKVLEVAVDATSKNTIWVKTTDHSKYGLYTLRIANVHDNFGNFTTKGDAMGHYAVNMNGLSRPRVTLIENDIANGKNVLTVTFDMPMNKSAMETVSNYAIEGLEILYVYQMNDLTVKIVTAPQKKGQIYHLILSNLESKLGAGLDTASTRNTFAGYQLD